MKKTQAKKSDFAPFMLEKLEDRIAPAAATVAPTSGLDPVDPSAHFFAVAVGSSILLKAGQGLSTSNDGGVYYLYVEKGQALVFTTDLNADNKIESNEITGISAGDGLKLISFVNINGDIVTNLGADGHLTDSDGDASNGRDGKIVLDSHIDSITLRSLTSADVPAGIDVSSRLAISDYSIFGNIYAGGGIGSDATPGLSIDTQGFALQGSKYIQRYGVAVTPPDPSIGNIYTGSAVSGKYFSFGTAPDYGDGASESLRGQLSKFTSAAGESGGDVNGIRVGISSSAVDPDGNTVELFTPVAFRIAGIHTGTGGFGAKGGDIANMTLIGDTEGFYAIAGAGGDGVTGGAGGSILHFAVSSTTVDNQVVLQTGDGGYGFLGAAGAAGKVSIDGDISLYGNVKIGLGKGGDGLGAAGAGTTLDKVSFSLPDIGLLTPVQFVSTYRHAGDLDRPLPIDFNGDGFTDAVFLSNNPQQLVVVFGDGNGGWSQTIAPVFLDASTYAPPEGFSSAVQVGDFNADGKLDIVTASSSGKDFDGLKVFINNGDGTFQDTRYSPLWQQFNGDVAITNLAVGDFNHDGTTSIAALYVGVDGFGHRFSDVVIMSGLKGVDGKQDGWFAADFQKHNGTVINAFPVNGVGDGTPQLMKATALVKGDVTSDAVVILDLTAQKAAISTYEVANIGTPLTPFPVLEKTGGAAATFRERTINSTTNTLVYQVANPISAFGFSILDVDGDGVYDPVVVGNVGENGVMVVMKGASDGSVSQPDDRGVLLTSTNAAIPSILLNVKLKSILGAVKSNFNSVSDSEIAVDAVLNVPTNRYNDTTNTIYIFDVNGGYVNPDPNAQVTNTGTSGGFTQVGTSFATFDSFFNSDQSTTAGFGGAVSLKFPDGHTSWAILAPNGGNDPDASLDIATNSLVLLAGGGGNSLLGKGGAGGSIGAGVTKDELGNTTASINVSKYLTAILVTGSGGSGLLGGGNSGNFNGILNIGNDLQYTTGSGGNSLLGRGGNGGSIQQVFLSGITKADRDSSLALFTGNGGFGLQGGAGGSIIGRGVDLSPDGVFDDYYMSTGDGGTGITAGGDGGNITSFVARYGDHGEVSGFVDYLQKAYYFSGAGGSAVAGTGGKGGSLTSLSPASGYNLSGGPIRLETGAGGDGLTGGAGGGIANFIDPTENNASRVRIVSGDGGRGVLGSGGVGGDITNVSITAGGAGGINTIIAGDGGLSSAGAGGAGGSLSKVTTTSEAGIALGAAGDGGDGLTSGGAGGSLTTVALDAGGLNTAGVIGMAGKGGNAYGVTAAQIAAEGSAPVAFQPLMAMGTANGKGGSGGSINGFIQLGHTQASTDLIAGNGGSTINYGVSSNTTSGVGKGGSISNVELAGDAGVMDKDVVIKDYSSSFIDDVKDFFPTSYIINNDIGNVGVLVGNNGFVRNGHPVSGVAGSVSHFTASNIMSMVAGSVENIASIASVTDIHANVVGAFKTGAPGHPVVTHVNGNAFYSNAHYTGTVISNAQQGGSLVDGAVVAATYNGPAGRVFANANS